jgi:hypothetical protein
MSSKFGIKGDALNWFKVTGHLFWRFAENRYCTLKSSQIFIKFSPNVRQCMQNNTAEKRLRMHQPYL